MLKEKLDALFDKYGKSIIKRMIQKMNQLDLNASGAAAKSLKYEKLPDGLIITGKDYFEQIDKGRRPNNTRPPMQPLFQWVQRRMAVEDIKEARRVAFAVQQTIAEKGTIKRFGYKGADILDFIIKTEIKNKFQPEAIKVVKDELIREAKRLKNELKKKQ